MTSYASLADPNGTNSLVAATSWLQGVLLGGVATSLAVIAIAVVGMRMLNGRMNWRRGTTTIIGCFILFGATSIARGIISTADGYDAGQPAPYIDTPRPPPPVPRADRPVDRDPYAGAAVPMTGRSWTGQRQ